LESLRTILSRALSETELLWPTIHVAYGWVHRVANILNNKDDLSGKAVRLRLRGLLGAISRHRELAGSLQGAIEHFLKVTRSYWPGLFHCYDVPGLPRTNNDLEHFFGSSRYHERRATGRKTASPALVLRGSVRMVASAATRMRTFSARDIAPRNIDSWRALRSKIEERREARVQRQRFRRDPATYLMSLEEELVKLTLPS
jgi:hypothetical protein